MSEEESICQICNAKYYYNTKKLSILLFKQDKEDHCFKCNLISYRYKGLVDILLYVILLFITIDLFLSEYFNIEFILFLQLFLLVLSFLFLFLTVFSIILTILGFYYSFTNSDLRIKESEKEKICHNCGRNFEKLWWGFFVFFGWKKDRCLNCTLLINRYYSLIITILVIIFSLYYIPHVCQWDFPYNLIMIVFVTIILISSAIQAFFGFYLRIKIR